MSIEQITAEQDMLYIANTLYAAEQTDTNECLRPYDYSTTTDVEVLNLCTEYNL